MHPGMFNQSVQDEQMKLSMNYEVTPVSVCTMTAASQGKYQCKAKFNFIMDIH